MNILKKIKRECIGSHLSLGLGTASGLTGSSGVAQGGGSEGWFSVA